MKELNLVEILKDVPKGVEFYSPIFGVCYFAEINNYDKDYPIRIRVEDKDLKINLEKLSSDGRYLVDFDGECVLFPSKENRDWESFTYFPIKEGDLVMAGDSNKADWSLAKYVKDNIVVIGGKNTSVKYIVPAKEFDFDNIESNYEKSVV